MICDYARRHLIVLAVFESFLSRRRADSRWPIPRAQIREVLLQHPQMKTEMIKLLHVAEGDIHVSHLVLDVFQAREFLIQLGARQAGIQSLVDFTQI
jgi:hypothetical protein